MLTAQFVGDREALRYAMRELPIIDDVLRYVRGRGTVVQAGGNLGVFPSRLAEVFANVATFEPDAENFRMLRLNVSAPNVNAFQMALGERTGTVGLSRIRRDGKLNHHAGIVHVSGEGKVPMISIDSLDLQACDAILLDVEGYELFALRGAIETIARCRPVVCVEVNKSLQYVGLTEADVMRFFMEQGYTYVAQRGSDRIFIPSEGDVCH
jgi:FkbM family methyltransferase